MSDQVIAAIITGTAAIIAALIGVLKWRERGPFRGQRSIVSGNVPPIFNAARAFARMTTLEEQKKTIQPIEVAMSNGTATLTRPQMEQCAGSDWELDRIGLYLFEEYAAQTNQATRVLHVRHEWERMEAAIAPRSLLPLHYALRSLLTLIKQQPAMSSTVTDSLDLFEEIRAFLKKHPNADRGTDVRRNVEKLVALLRKAEAA